MKHYYASICIVLFLFFTAHTQVMASSDKNSLIDKRVISEIRSYSIQEGTGEVPLSFAPSWNLFALPIQSDIPFTAESLLDAITSQGGNCSEIDRWRSSGWDAHVHNLPFNDFPLQMNEGYFIKCAAASTLTYSGSTLTQSQPLSLQAGWNLAALPYPPSYYTAESLLDAITEQGGNCSEIDRWRASGWDAHVHNLPFNDFALQTNEGYFLKCAAASTFIPYQGAPDLSISKSGPALALPGDVLRYQIGYANNGVELASGVVITETLPALTSFNAAASTPGWEASGANQYVYRVGNQAANGGGSVMFAVTAAQSFPVGTTAIQNTVSISDDGSHGQDPNLSNNTASVSVPTTSGPTNVCGAISTNTTWPADHSPYVVTCSITINSGITLTVGAGSIIKFGGTYSISVNGTLVSQGTAAAPVYFTSIRDDSVGGDTNGDGNNTSPYPGSWSYIHLNSTGQVSLPYTTLSYGGNSSGELYLSDGATATLDHTTIRKSYTDGIYVSGSSTSTHLTITNSTIADNAYYGIHFSYGRADGLVINGADFLNNGSYPLSIDMQSASYQTLENIHAVGNGHNAVYLSGVFSHDITLPANLDCPIVAKNWTINAGVTLTIPAGSVIKNDSSSSISVNGTLVSQGTAAAPVYFTSIRDDSVGGDTNGDGNNTSPYPGSWSYIHLNSTGQVSLPYTTLSYGGNSSGELYLSDGATATLDHTTIRKSHTDGIYVSGSSTTTHLTITNSTIADNAENGIEINANSQQISITNSQILNNTRYGIYNSNTSTMIQARNNWWGAASGPVPYGSGNGINYRTCTDPQGKSYICQYYVDVVPWLGQAETYGQQVAWNAYAAEPVNTANGNYTYAHTDLSIPTRSLPLQLGRSYNSAYPEGSVMGFGWMHSYQVKAVENSSDQSVTISFGDGHAERYTWNGSAFTPPVGVFSTLSKVDGLFRLKLKDQTLYNFNGSGQLASLTDRNGNVTTLSYVGSVLDRVTAPDGRMFTFTYNAAGRLQQVTDPLGRTVQYGYDAVGNLTSLTDPSNQTTHYTYDANHRLLSITDANGHTFVTNVYTSDGRVSEQYDAQNHKTTFAYDILNHKTTVTDPLGHATIYQYDASLRLTGETNGLGKTESYTYDASNNRTSLTDRNSHTTTYTYDAQGNVLTVADARNGVSSYTYDAQNNLLSFTDANQHTTTYTYDANGNRLSATNALDHTTSYTYYADANRLGLLATVTDPLNHTTTYDYNPNGDLTSVTDAVSHTQTYSYDTGGRKLTFTDARSHTWSYTYDNLNRLLTETDPQGGITTYSYDAVGNRLSKEDANHAVTAYAYNEKDQLVSVTDAEHYTTTYTYDAVGNKRSEMDGNNHTTTYGYDAANRLVTITNPLNQAVGLAYDDAGNLTISTDPLGHATTTSYDELDRPVTVTDPLGYPTTKTFDAVGNVLSITDPNNQTTTYTYTAINQLETATDARSGVVRYGYDAYGNRISVEDANRHTTTYAYNELNLLISSTDPLGHSSSNGYDENGNRITATDANGHTITYSYDALNRLMSIAYNDGTSVTYTYDAVGKRLTMADSLGTTSYTYDALYRPLSITSPTGTISYTYDAKNCLTLTSPAGMVTYTYDAADRIQIIADWQQQVTNYTYDAAGRQTGISYPNGVVTTNVYDEANRLTGITLRKDATSLTTITYTLDAAGNRLTMTDGDGTTSYTYDELNRLTGVTYPVGSPANVSYTYDPMGNRLSMSQDGAATSYAYNAADQLTTVVSGGITTSYTWDNNGNLLSKGNQTFTWDRANRLVAWTDGSNTASYQYNGDGVRLGKTIGGVQTTYLQDMAGALPVVVREITAVSSRDYVYGSDLIASKEPGSWFFYHTDGLGSTRLLTNGSGAVTDRYRYAPFGELLQHDGSTNQPFTFTGEQFDPEGGLIYLRARYYDPMSGRFLSPDPFLGFDTDPQSRNPYAYARNNPIINIDPSGKVFNIVMAGVGAGIGAGIDLGMQAIGNLRESKGAFEDINWGSVAGSAASGSLAGFTCGGSLATQVAFGAGKGALSYGVKHMVGNTINVSIGDTEKNEAWSWGDLASSSMVGGFTSAIFPSSRTLGEYEKPLASLGPVEFTYTVALEQSPNQFVYSTVVGKLFSSEMQKRVFKDVLSIGLQHLSFTDIVSLFHSIPSSDTIPMGRYGPGSNISSPPSNHK